MGWMKEWGRRVGCVTDFLRRACRDKAASAAGPPPKVQYIFWNLDETKVNGLAVVCVCLRLLAFQVSYENPLALARRLLSTTDHG